MHPYRVVKFGGSNLKSLTDIQRILDVIGLYKQPAVVVFSAFYGITDELSGVIDKCKESHNHIHDFTDKIRQIKYEIFDNYISNAELREEAKASIERRFDELQKKLTGIHYIGDIPDFLRDEILSYGERFSSLIFTYIFRDKGYDCEELLPENIPFYTDGEYRNATIETEWSSQHFRKYLNGKMYVVPGFYGVSAEHKVTLLGRGGSDYSAAAIANCIQAESLDVWKDVDGFLSADPCIVDETRNVRNLTYSESAELAYFGSKILHPRTMEPLKSKGIPVNIFNIRNITDITEPLTTISDRKSVSREVIKSISYSDDFGIIKLWGSGVGIKPGILAKITTVLDQANINIKSVITSQIAINILLDIRDVFKAEKLIRNAEVRGIEQLTAVYDISVVAVVGEGLVSRHGIAAKTFHSVAEKGINIEMISFGASHVAAYFIVNNAYKAETVRAIHNEFFVSPAKSSLMTDNSNVNH
jgi:aspartate kinase/aspartokinase/homoserine dehydrogenase 1